MPYSVRRDRVEAVPLCKQKGWSRGTQISSTSWVCDREIERIGERFVTVKYLMKGVGSRERVLSFPLDVQQTA